MHSPVMLSENLKNTTLFPEPLLDKDDLTQYQMQWKIIVFNITVYTSILYTTCLEDVDINSTLFLKGIA